MKVHFSISALRNIVVKFLKPNLKKISLFLFLSFICVGGAIQSYAFVHDVPGLTKPPFYDLLNPLGLWIAWVFLAVPVHIFGYFLGFSWILKFFPNISSATKLPLISIAYSYLVSCWVVHVWGKWLRFESSEIKLIFFFTALVLAAMFSPLPLHFIFLFSVFLVYFISAYGLIKVLKEYSRK